MRVPTGLTACGGENAPRSMTNLSSKGATAAMKAPLTFVSVFALVSTCGIPIDLANACAQSVNRQPTLYCHQKKGVLRTNFGFVSIDHPNPICFRPDENLLHAFGCVAVDFFEPARDPCQGFLQRAADCQGFASTTRTGGGDTGSVVS